MRDWVKAYIGIGANLGTPAEAIAKGVSALIETPGIAQCRVSSLYSSAPVDSSGPDYTNAVLELKTQLTAPALLAVLQSLEREAGRERPYRNAPRTLDLDLLLFGQANIQSPSLTVPHPRMWDRAFVVLPLAELGGPGADASAIERVRGQTIRVLPR